MMDQEPLTAGDTASLPEATAKAEPQSPMMPTFIEVVASVLEDLPSTAVSVRADRFKQDGIGPLGSMFRLLAKSKDTPAEEEFWAQILEIASSLWDAEFHDASVKLLKDAQLRLTPPDAFKDHFKDSIEFGIDYGFFLKAQQKFDEGDEIGAAASIAKMSDANRKEMQAQLKLQGSTRKKSRQRAFVASGIAGSFLVVAIFISIGTFRDFMANPPKFEIRDFDMNAALPEMNFGDATNGAKASTPPPIPVAPDVFPAQSQITLDQTSPAPLPASTPDPTTSASEQIFSSFQDDVNPTSIDTPGIVDPPAFDRPSAPMDPSDDELFSQRAETPSMVVASQEQIENCALAFRVSAIATRQAFISSDAKKIARASVFQDKFIAACAELNIPIETLQSAVSDIPDDTILSFANSILSTD